MKIFAYYLPQFHCIPENDKWWGKGFTEWTNVKKAQPLFKGHKQPKEPLGDNYYSLDNIDTMKWQSNLLRKYKIDGLIFYHYYFQGKKLLEKPVEMFLKHQEIKIDYFFCWANHDWYRSWEGSKELLLEQTYGSKKDWDEHFNYLLSFFKDKRYQKKNNKPLLMVFNSDFEEKKEMFDYFDRRCKENGFAGISIIEKFESYDLKKKNVFMEKISNQTDFIHLREPGSSLNSYKSNVINFPKRVYLEFSRRYLGNVKVYDGNKLLKIMTKSKIKDDRVVRGLFFEWDNTPRHSKRGYVITPPNKNVFLEFMDSIEENEFLFINAWNEWCEGMILEPTKENGYKYLEWIKEWREKL